MVRILTHNTTSLVRISRRKEAEKIHKEKKIDISLLQETHLNKRHKFYMEGCKVFRCDGGAGTAVVTNKKLNAERHMIANLEVVVCCAIKVKLSTGASAMVASIYVPCNCPKEKLRGDLDLLAIEGEKFDEVVFGGDWNGRHPTWNEPGDSNTNSNGKWIHKWLTEYGELELVGATKNTFRGKSMLDYFITSKGVCRGAAVHVDVRLDHQPIMVEAWRGAKLENEGPKRIEVWKGDWEAFRTDMTAELMKHPIRKEDLNSQTDIDAAIRKVEDVFGNVKGLHTKAAIIGGDRSFVTPPEIEKLYRWRRMAKRHSRRQGKRDVFVRQCMLELVKELSELILVRWEKHREEKLAEELRGLDPKKNLWPTIKRMSGRSKGGEVYGLKAEDGGLLSKDEIPETFAEHLRDLYAPRSPRNTQAAEISRDFEREFDLQDEDTEEVKTEELLGMKRRLNNKKSSGVDGISCHVLKKFPMAFWDYSAAIFSACLKEGYFPSRWKEGLIIPIPKKKAIEKVEDCRPITMLSNWGKCLERIILNRMRNDEWRVIGVPDNQYAYREGHKASDAVRLVQLQAEVNRQDKLTTAIIALDCTKAFDSVWHEGLLWKLKKVGFPQVVIKMTKSFLQQRYARIRVNDRTSETFVVGRGVPQGSILGPVMYNLYTADIRESDDMAQYADDFLLWKSAKNAEKLEEKIGTAINSITRQLSQWGIEVNKKKTQIMVVPADTKGGRGIWSQLQGNGIRLDDGTRLRVEKSLKYLGVDINWKLKEEVKLKEMARKGRAAFFTMSWFMRNKSLSMVNKRRILEAVIRPVTLYGIDTIITRGAEGLKILGKEERKTIRSMTGLYKRPCGRYYPSTKLYETIGSEPIEKVAMQRIEKAAESRQSHENEVLKKKWNELEEKIMGRRAAVRRREEFLASHI